MKGNLIDILNITDNEPNPLQMSKPETFRKEIHLTQEVIDKLQEKADKDDRSLKNYMEKVLINDSKKD